MSKDLQHDLAELREEMAFKMFAADNIAADWPVQRDYSMNAWYLKHEQPTYLKRADAALSVLTATEARVQAAYDACRDRDLASLRASLAAAQAELAGVRGERDELLDDLRCVRRTRDDFVDGYERMEEERDQARAERDAARFDSDAWYEALRPLARALGCLPSKFSGENGHIVVAAERIVAERDALQAAMRDINHISPAGTRTQEISFYALHPTNAKAHGDEQGAVRVDWKPSYEALTLTCNSWAQRATEAEQARDRAIAERDKESETGHGLYLAVMQMQEARDRAVAEGQRLREALTGPTLKRYELEDTGSGYESYMTLVEQTGHNWAYGDWCKYEDVVAALAPTPATGRGECHGPDSTGEGHQ